MGLVCDGRRYDEVRDALGPLARHVPLRCPVADEESFAAWPPRIEPALREAIRHQEYHAAPDRAESFLRFSFEAVHEIPAVAAAGVTFRIGAPQAAVDRFSVQLGIVLGSGGLRAELRFDAGALTAAAAEQLARRFETLLGDALARPQAAVGELALLGEAERRGELEGWQPAPVAWPDQRPAHRRIEERARRQPAQPALLWEGGSLTFAELNERANRLAHHLRSLGVGPEVFLFQSQGVVDDDLAAEGHESEGVADSDDLDGILVRGPFGVLVGEGDLLVGIAQRALDGDGIGRKGHLDGIGEGAPVLLGEFEITDAGDDARAAGVGILIRATAGHEHGSEAGPVLLQILLGEAGVVAAPVIESETGVVTGVAEEDSARLALGALDAEGGDLLIDGAGGIGSLVGIGMSLGQGVVTTAIHRESGAGLVPGEAGGFEIGKGGVDDFVDLLFETLRVFPGVFDLGVFQLLVRGSSGTTSQLGAAVRVRGVHEERGRRDAVVLLDAPGNAPAEILRNADEIEGDDDLLFASFILENEGFGKEVLNLTLGRLVPSRVARHPDVFLRSHDNGREAGFPLHWYVGGDGDGSRFV